MKPDGFLRVPFNSLEVWEEPRALLLTDSNHYLKEISAVPS